MLRYIHLLFEELILESRSMPSSFLDFVANIPHYLRRLAIYLIILIAIVSNLNT